MSDLPAKTKEIKAMADKSDAGESTQRCHKRVRSDAAMEGNEPVIKKSTFKLQPATLIHGMKKATPKSNQPSEQNKCKFLQPSKLQPPSSATTTSLAASSGRFKTDSHTSSSVSGESKASNPFLICKDTDDEEGESSPKKQKSSSNDAVEKKKEEKSNNEAIKLSPPTKFSQATPARIAAATPSQNTGGGTFVFGQRLSERAKVEDGNGEKKKEDKLPSFSNVEKSQKKSDEEKETEESAAAAAADSVANEEARRKLEENAAEHFAATQTKTIAPAVDVITGEEDEKNVLQIQCKLYQYDQKTQAWKERGVGSLHLNDCKLSCNDLQFQSRLVMRTHGSMRVVLNTKVWAQMSVDRASQKSIRITAQTQSADIGVYLISGSANDMEQVYRAIEYRVLHQKQAEEQCNKKSNGTTTGSESSEKKPALTTEKDTTATKVSASGDNSDKTETAPPSEEKSAAVESATKNN